MEGRKFTKQELEDFVNQVVTVEGGSKKRMGDCTLKDVEFVRSKEIEAIKKAKIALLDS